MHLNQLRHKLIAELTLVLREPLHIGSGEFGARRTLLRLSGRLVIPASTWKGALRNIAEIIARNMFSSLSGLERITVLCYSEETSGIRYRWDDEHAKRFLDDVEVGRMRDEYYRARDGFVENLLSQVESLTSASSIHGLGEELLTMLDLGYRLYSEQELGRIIQRLRRGDDETVSRMFEDYLSSKCPIGSLFGNGALAGKVRPMDTVLGSKYVEERPGVGINRKSGKVEWDVLYFTEVVPAGTEVRLKIVADNLFPGQTDSRLFAGVLEWIRELGLNIGGRKSVGLGLLELRDSRIWVWELGRGRDTWGEALANPFKNLDPLDVRQAVSWLRGS